MKATAPPTAVCAECRFVMDASNRHCPVCLKLRTSPTGEAAPPVKTAAVTRMPPSKLPSPRARAAMAVGAVVLVIALTQSRKKASFEPIDTGPLRERAPYIQESPPVASLETPMPEEPPPPPPPTVPADAPPGRSVLIQEKPEEPRSEPVRRSSARRPTAAAAPSWAVSGLVYDLMSLKPVAGAKLVFQDKSSGKAVASVSGRDGRYAVGLPKISEGGYELTITHRSYGSGYLEEMSPPYRRQSQERRREAADQIQSSDVLHVPLLPEKSEKKVSYDVVLMPR